jgi:hypothetical protein
MLRDHVMGGSGRARYHYCASGEMDSTNRQSGSGPLPLRSQTVAFPSGWGMATDNAGR